MDEEQYHQEGVMEVPVRVIRNDDPEGEVLVAAVAEQGVDNVGNDDSDGEEEGEEVAEVPLADLILDPLDPRRMQLTNEERQWALNIKQAITASPEINDMSDFSYAQLALTDRGDLQAALERAAHMQAFREEYKILDSMEDGMRSLKTTLQVFPAAFLSFSYSNSHGSYCFVYDMAAFDLYKLNKQPGLFQSGMWGIYYLGHCMAPDFQSMRRGAIFLVECQGFDWKRNVDLKTIRTIWVDFLAVYPFQIQKMKYFHSGLFINLINSLKKRFLPKHIVDKMEIGCMFERRLSDIYLVPDIDAAAQRLLSALECSLNRRYENERSFVLSGC
ncbi:expressed unknown protein [Seminavis robusta]|uniref:CRAL-TRIO domain-containing protein n=1 Tax=Seminavis robusta TaxID=568900 RepID=A0A9N8H9H2_9STRA|nr:expressed unknown protein [Seminavis robusta]|eukprot:Sro254_g100190.1 n/a (330) ;mRNA; r:48023-49115